MRDARLAAGNTGVIACSALTHAARSLLRRDGVVLVLLRVPADTLETRVRERHHAFMPASLLQSQFRALEMPGEDETDVLRASIDAPVDAIVDGAVGRWSAC